MSPAYLIEMLQLQDRMNQRIHPEWIKQDYNWARAAFVETAELLEHVGWKWWKHQVPDLTQARLELVDIWHFVLSDALVDHDGRVQPAALDLLEGWETPIDKIVVATADDKTCVAELPLQARIQVFGSLAGLTGTMMPALFRNICEELGLSSSRLYTLYLQKNVLNMFRQNNGYKEGTYQKVWDGKEDNVVLAEIVESLDRITHTTLYQALTDRYPK